MSRRAIAIGLKIPDNAAYTAQRALERLGVAVHHVERSEILLLDDGDDGAALQRCVERNQALFNPNKHRLTLLDGLKPRAGETWIEEIGERAGEARYVGWRLFDATHRPVANAVVAAAVDALLCNPAIERALLPDEGEE